MSKRIDWTKVSTQTRGVLGGAYKGRDISARALLTHLCAVDADGMEYKVGCSGVKLDSITDQFGHTEEGLKARPTCPICAAKWDKIHEAQS